MKFKLTKQYFLQRYTFFFAIFIILLIIVIMRLVIILSDANLAERSKNQTYNKVEFNTPRGEIFARNGEILAGNIAKVNVNLDPQNIPIIGTKYPISGKKEIDEKAKKIVSIWQLSPEYQKIKNTTLTKKIKTMTTLGNDNKNIKPFSVVQYLAQIAAKDYKKLNNQFIDFKTRCLKQAKCKRGYYLITGQDVLGKKIKQINKLKQNKILICKNYQPSLSKWEKIANYLPFVEIPKPKATIFCTKQKTVGIYLENTPARIYPQSPSTTPLIGAIDKENIGVFGLEAVYQNYLKSNSYYKTIKKTVGDKKNYYAMELLNTQKPKNLNLTIDNKLQFYLFDAIKNTVDKYAAKSGAGIIINPNGEILALTNYPTNDVNQFISSNYDYYINRPLADNLEIASTIKPLITSALLEESRVDINETIEFTQEETTDAKNHYNSLTIREILQKSYTPGSVKITKKLTPNEIYNYLQKLGFGEPLGVLPSIESPGVLKHFSNWSDSDYKSISYGYGPLNATLAQLVRAYMVFITDGKIKNLKLLQNTENTESQVFSKQTIKQIIPALEDVINSGTATRAKLDSVQGAGKTGTARLLINGKYQKNRNNAFFVGFAPSHNAKYLMAVVINDPVKSYVREGGYIAAPIFKEVMQKLF
jgi:cell division protein FtsI (penicillin-binding protein 3)